MHRSLPLRAALVVCFAALCPPAAHAATYTVSPAGNDGRSGLGDANAWRTVQKAADSVRAGDVVVIRGGWYPEDVVLGRSGAQNDRIRFEGRAGETARIRSFLAVDKWHVELRRLTFENFRERSGIKVERGGDFDVRECVVRNGRASNHAAVRFSGDWWKFINNKVHDTDPGLQEGIRVESDAHNWEIKNNDVYNVKSIGIIISGWDIYKEPYDGVVEKNYVWNCGEPTGVPSSGIYIDSSRKIKILRNYSAYNRGPGIQIGAEDVRGDAHDNVVAYNVSKFNGWNGILVGGYRSGADKARVYNNRIFNNVCYRNGRQAFGFQYNNEGDDNKIYNNVFWAKDSGQEYVRRSPVAANRGAGNVFGNNAFYGGNRNTGTISGGGNLIDQDPRFVNAGGNDFKINANSPLINRGNGGFRSEPDYYGNTGYSGSPDIGVHER